MTFDTSDQLSPASSLSFDHTDQRAKSSQPEAASNGDWSGDDCRQTIAGCLAQFLQTVVAETPGGPLFVPLIGLVSALVTAGFAATVTSPFGWRAIG
jgi:hypothetical protein